MPKRITKVPHEYAGRQWKVGEAFECEPQHVALMLMLGRIEPEEGEIGYEVRDMVAAGPGSYLTRDMQPKRRGRPRKGTQ